MRRFVVVALCGTAVCASSFSIGTSLRADQQEPRFRAGTFSVSVYATVVDEFGRLVPGLAASDFEVFDNGVRQDVTLFSDAPQPISIVLMIDRSSSVEQHFDVVRDAAGVFIDHLLPVDRARVGSFSSTVQIDPDTFTSDRKELHRLLSERLQPPGPTPLWNGTIAALDALRPESHRRVVLVFTDGKDSSSPLSSNATFGDVRSRLESDDTMLYAIGLATKCDVTEWTKVDPIARPASTTSPAVLSLQSAGQRGRGRVRLPPPPPIIPGRPPTLPEPGRIPGVPPSGRFGKPTGSDDTSDKPRCKPTTPDPGLRELAVLSGGGYFELSAAEKLQETFSRVAAELHQQYLLAFPAAVDGKTHAIDVRVKDVRLTVRARKSYIASAGSGRVLQHDAAR